MSLEAELRAPLFTSPIHSLSLAAHMVDRDNSTFASHWEHLQGAKITYEVRRAGAPIRPSKIFP